MLGHLICSKSYRNSIGALSLIDLEGVLIFSVMDALFFFFRKGSINYMGLLRASSAVPPFSINYHYWKKYIL